MDQHEFRLKTMLREVLAIQLYESGLRANLTPAQNVPSWLEMDRREQDIWRGRGSRLIDSEINR